MKEVYTIPEVERENVLNVLSRYSKKAIAYGQPLSYETGEPYATTINVYVEEYDSAQCCVVTKKSGTRLVEVFDLTIDSEVIRKDGYSVIAKVEHLHGGNVVYAFGEEETKIEWTTCEPKCDHCRCKRGQKTTFIVRDTNGNEKQVGRTCLKDYCGIDPQRIGMMKQLKDLFISMEPESYDFRSHPTAWAYSTINALALALRVQKAYGYVSSSEPNSSKEKLHALARNNETPTEAEYAQAEVIAEKIVNMSQEDSARYTLDNVRTLLKSGYCKFAHFGYIAYAPLAFERYLEKLARQAAYDAEKEVERKASEHIGQVGQRITIEIADMKLITSWEGDWGYTYLYKFIDTAGNVLIWYASRAIDEAKKLKATIKDHTERDGIKQTVVTRCAVVAA